MSDSDLVRILVGQHQVGIVGLKGLMEEISVSHAEKTDDEVGAFMVERLECKNYIPASARELYAKALVREFRKSLGHPVDKAQSEGLTVQVIGPGCSQCDHLERMVMEVMSELNLPGRVDHVRDVREISELGIMGVPALIVNGKVLAVGSVPARNRIRTWLLEATAPIARAD